MKRTGGWRRILPAVVAGLILALVILSLTSSNPSNVLAQEPGVNCSSYTGPGGVCVVEVGDIWFCDASYQDGVCPTSIVAGDIVRWVYPSSGLLIHTTRECGATCDAPTASPLWASGLMYPGDSFEFTFTTPGQYLYYCVLHPVMQRGAIRVLEPAPDPTPTPTGQPTAAPPPGDATSTPTQGTAPNPALPAAGSAGGGAGFGWTAIAGLILAFGGLLLLSWSVHSGALTRFSR